MSRTRSTWTDGSRQAATTRRADIYTMNQDHPQPSVTEYENGDPDSWAETPTTNKNVEMEYEGDHVKRNEVGFAEFRPDTFKHKDSDQWNGSGKYDNQRQAAERKASYAERVARFLLRTSNDKLVEAQTTDLMALPVQVLASTLKRLDSVSPDALTKEQKYRRALACCKLAANILPDSAGEGDVQRLATALMSIDDPTLKEILKISASVKVSADDEEEDDAGKSAGEEKDEEDAAKTSQVQQQAAPEQEEEAEKGPPANLSNQEMMSAEEMAMLDQMLAEETGCAPAPAPAPPIGLPGGPAPELTQLFAPPAAAPLAPMAAAAPQIAMDEADINFDEEDEGSSQVAAEGDELSDLFSDDSEVQAQREIQAAEREQLAAAGGYGPNPATRTASTGAKKIGAVRATRGAPDAELDAIWDRP